MSAQYGPRSLRKLAKLYGVQTAYYDVSHERKSASVESLLSVLGSLGAPVSTPEDAPSAIREWEQNFWRRPLDPVVVDWEGVATSTELRLPSHLSEVPLQGHLALENGERELLEWNGRRLRTLRAETVEGVRYEVKELPLKGFLPLGYHRLTVDIPGRPAETLIISAPEKGYTPGVEWDSKAWGVFLPLYSLYSQKNRGSGTFSHLEALIEWIAKLGGSVAATLPLLAAFLDEPFEPSPYAPASRLLWNEFYIDINRIPDIADCASAQKILASDEFQREAVESQKSNLVDYRREMTLKRRILEELAASCFEGHSTRLEELRRFVETNPIVEDYARFRATGEKYLMPWSEWMEPLRNGVISDGDFDPKAERYHIYVQWLANQQMGALSRRANERGLGLYLDLPLGVNADGYDVWRNQELFVKDTRVGAPPDSFFTRGQDWGFPPVHPDRIRKQGYGYLIDVFRHHLRYAGILRIDHVMGLHRLYWVPPGGDARYGAYVRYRADELYAILTLESQKQLCWIVGENLGTVPSYVNAAMSRHGFGRMYVAQFETNTDAKKALNSVPSNTVASFNTHDLPMFSAFWQGLDIEDRHSMGLLEDAELAEQRKSLQQTQDALTKFLQDKGFLTEEPTPAAIYAACMKYLGASPGSLVLVNLEDLWLEEQPQNVPGTSTERPNWRRKARYSFEEFTRMPEVLNVLQEIDRLRD